MRFDLTHLCLLVTAGFIGTATAQSASSIDPATVDTPIEVPGFEDGVASFTGFRTWIMPAICNSGCVIPVAHYRNCFYEGKTLTEDGQEITFSSDQDMCNDYLCDTESFEHIRTCLDCVVANGNERHVGYHTDPEQTATGLDRELADLTEPVDGYLNETLANEWLENIVDRCSGIDRPLEDVTTTVTASPTTTGPYATTFTSGQTVIDPIWTGLTEYTERFTASGSLPWASALDAAIEAGGNPTRPTNPPSSSSAAASDSPNAAVPKVPMGSLGWVFATLGLLWI